MRNAPSGRDTAAAPTTTGRETHLGQELLHVRLDLPYVGLRLSPQCLRCLRTLHSLRESRVGCLSGCLRIDDLELEGGEFFVLLLQVSLMLPRLTLLLWTWLKVGRRGSDDDS